MNDSKFREQRKKTGGRKRGTPNKTTASLRAAVLGAFEKAGGEDYLLKLSDTDPRTFCTLLSRILPTEAKIETEVAIDHASILDAAIARVAKQAKERQSAVSS